MQELILGFGESVTWKKERKKLCHGDVTYEYEVPVVFITRLDEHGEPYNEYITSIIFKERKMYYVK